MSVSLVIITESLMEMQAISGKFLGSELSTEARPCKLARFQAFSSAFNTEFASFGLLDMEGRG